MTPSSCDGSHYGETSRTRTGDIAMYTTNLYMTYILLVWGWKVNGLRSSTQRICKCTELWAVKQTDGGKTSKTKPGLQPLKTKWQHSAHPLLSFIWPAVSSWDDQHSKLTRDGKWAPSQQDTPVQLVYTIVLKTCTKEALSSVTLPTPLMKYLISNLQPEEKNKTMNVQTEATVSPLMLYL